MTVATSASDIVGAVYVDDATVHEEVRRRRPIGIVLACTWLVAIVGAAVIVDLLPIIGPQESAAGPRLAPFQMWPEFLGTDAVGRSQVSRVLHGGRVSLLVGFGAGMAGLTIGGFIGMLAGVSRRRFDAVVGFFTEIMLAFPGLVLLLGMAAILGPGLATVLISLSLFSIPAFIRISRANTLRVVQSEFVTAARAIGTSRTRILLREIMPNVLPPVLAYAPLVIAGLIVAEASLSYLGVGLVAPTPSWGSSIAMGETDFRRHPYMVFVPAAPLFLTVLSVSVVGQWLQRRIDAP
jgi:peptide/nickel transport system permease protein